MITDVIYISAGTGYTLLDMDDSRFYMGLHHSVFRVHHHI